MKDKVINLGFLYILIYDGGFWFRFFRGFGIAGKDTNKMGLTFSERHGHAKTLRIKNWSFKILKRK